MPGRAAGGPTLKGYQLAQGPNVGMEACPDHIGRHQEYDATGMSVHSVIPLYTRRPNCGDCKNERRLRK